MNWQKRKALRSAVCMMIMGCLPLQTGYANVGLGGEAESSRLQGRFIIRNDVIEPEIDRGERALYRLLPGIPFPNFASAAVIRGPDDLYRAWVTYEEDSQKKHTAFGLSEENLNRLHEQTGEVPPAKTPVPADSLFSVLLKDGTKLTGRVVQEDEVSVTIVTPAHLEVKVPKSSIVSIKPVQGRIVEGVFHRFDPNYSRLMFAPTGRPLRRGEGYFSDYYVLFPGISYGITDYVSFMIGMSVVPGLGLSDQLRYVAPRIGIRASDEFAVSAGALYVSVEDVAAGIVFAVGSIGRQDKSFTAAIGLGYTKEEEEEFKFAEHPILVVGGNVRLSNSIALVSENWFITGEGLGLDEQPFAIAVRFFGDRLAVDAGLIIIGKVLEEGFPIPWLSFVYNFGRR